MSRLAFIRGRIESFLSVNGYAYTTNPPATQTDGSETDVAYMMAESLMGSTFTLGNLSSSKTSITLTRGIYMWPGANVWEYDYLTCTTNGTEVAYIRQKNDIKPVKSIAVALNFHDLILGYKTYQVSSQNNATVDNNEPLSTQMWGDYIHVRTPKHQLSKFYSTDLEYGYWKNTGRHIDFRIHILFNKTIQATINSFNFKSFGSLQDSYGISGVMHYQFA